jgi:hypothetical protein
MGEIIVSRCGSENPKLGLQSARGRPPRSVVLQNMAAAIFVIQRNIVIILYSKRMMYLDMAVRVFL